MNPKHRIIPISTALYGMQNSPDSMQPQPILKLRESPYPPYTSHPGPTIDLTPHTRNLTLRSVLTAASPALLPWDAPSPVKASDKRDKYLSHLPVVDLAVKF